VVGYAFGPSIDARLAMGALKAAIRARKPSRGSVHHSDRGSQYAAEANRKLLAEHGLVGSMGWRGNPYESAKAESFMKTLKVEAFKACSRNMPYLPMPFATLVFHNPEACCTVRVKPRINDPTHLTKIQAGHSK
jgi:transposase InsO family protein